MPRRESINKENKKLIFSKTGGLCHFCGKKLNFEAKRGYDGRWHIDHIFPFSRGGKNCLENYLPICRSCNRLKWHFTGNKIREIFRYGVIAEKEVIKKSELGRKIEEIYDKILKQNQKLRKGKLPNSYYE